MLYGEDGEQFYDTSGAYCSGYASLSLANWQRFGRTQADGAQDTILQIAVVQSCSMRIVLATLL